MSTRSVLAVHNVCSETLHALKHVYERKPCGGRGGQGRAELLDPQPREEEAGDPGVV